VYLSIIGHIGTLKWSPWTVAAAFCMTSALIIEKNSKCDGKREKDEGDHRKEWKSGNEVDNFPCQTLSLLAWSHCT
jgi:hypothetical protein